MSAQGGAASGGVINNYMRVFFVETLKDILGVLARIIISIYNPKIIAVTGSAGKTSAKEAIFSALKNGNSKVNFKKKKKVWRSKGNLNTEFGLILSIFNDWDEKELKIVSREQPAGTKKIRKTFFWIKAIIVALRRIVFPISSTYANFLVLEYGADRPGDIKKLLRIARPKIGVVTSLGDIPVHIEFYKEAEEVAREKGKIIKSLPSNGFAILNCDDRLVFQMKNETKANVITFGFCEEADIKISNFSNVYEDNVPSGVSFKIEYQGNVVPVNLKNSFGRPCAYAVATAFAVGVALNKNLIDVVEAIEKNYKPAKRRMNFFKAQKNFWIIDDSYNASPLSTEEALSALKDIKAKRKVAILGDMLELGDYSIIAHRKIGELAADSAEVIISIGERAKILHQIAEKRGFSSENNFYFKNVKEAMYCVENILEEGDLVLVKASRGIGLDKLVDAIK